MQSLTLRISNMKAWIGILSILIAIVLGALMIATENNRKNLFTGIFFVYIGLMFIIGSIEYFTQYINNK